VLDQQHRQALLVADPPDERRELSRLLRIHPCGGLVEQQELRVGSERPRHLEPPLVAVGKASCPLPMTARKPAVEEELARSVARLGLLALHAARTQDGADDAGVQPAVHPDEHVLDGVHLGEQPDVLERPADPESRDRVGRHVHHLGPVEDDRPRRRLVDAGELVEERRLPGAVRPDQRHDRPARDREVDVVGRDQAPELLADPGRDEQVVRGRHHSLDRSRSVRTPSVCTS
jgi:hypothetical protein